MPNILNFFRKPKPETQYDYEADGEFIQYLDMCKKDILENLPESRGGIYIGSDKNEGVTVIGYGKTEYIRRGFKSILEHHTLKQIFLEVYEANKEC